MKTISPQEIVYIGDPLCSWCWGISNALEQLKANHKEDMVFTIILGGLRPGGTDRMDKKFSSFLRHHWEEVHKASGQPFNFGILQNQEFVYDTEPPCRAVRIVRDMKPEVEFEFFQAVQSAFYIENRDTGDVSTYLPICKSLGIDSLVFTNAFNSREAGIKVAEDFELAQRMGIRSFPTVIVRAGHELHLIASGYADFGQMEDAIASLQKTGIGK